MKKVVLSSLCLLLVACSTEKPCYRENCFVTQTEVTADMQKIHSILLNHYKKEMAQASEYNLKYTDVVCRLFGKNNKQLNKEIDKLQKFYLSEGKLKEIKKSEKELEKSLKGLKLNYAQVLQLAKELNKDITEISKSNEKKFAPYKSRALEIVKAIDAQKEKQDTWRHAHYEDELQWETKFLIYYSMKGILTHDHNKFSSYDTTISHLESLISDGTFVDSFLAKHPSAILPKEEGSFNLNYFLYSLTPPTAKNGEIIFDAVRNAALSKNISKQELSDLVELTAKYMIDMTSNVVEIQHDVTDKIDFNSLLSSYKERELNNFYSYDRHIITNLVDKYPKSEDFEREINKLTTRLAYQTYYKVNISRFLYREWKETYYSQIKELFANAVIIADKLYAQIKDDVITDDTTIKRRFEHQSNMQNISNIKEIAKIGVDKILTSADCYIDSQEEIKAALYKSFMKTREAYLKNVRK